jgi:predicted dehydrogenase
MKTSARRTFLKKTLAPLVIAPFAGMQNKSSECFSESNRTHDDKQLKVALMGLGSYATRVADAMKDCKKAKLVGAISGTPSKLIDWKSKYGIVNENCYSYESMLNIKSNKAIDAVYVITPNALHKEHTIKMAEAGKHVICEKPMAINAKDARMMIDACKTNNVKLLIGYRMHFEAKTLEAVRMRKSGELGKIMFFQGLAGFRIGDPGQWRLTKKLAGGGAMMDIGIYAINGARYMIGEEPLWVSAQETKTDFVKFKQGVDETITFQMGFPSGATASCLSTYAMNNLDRFYLNGTENWVEMQPSTGYGPIKAKSKLGEFTHTHITHQTTQMDEMAEIILNGNQPVIAVDGEEGYKDMVIIDAIFKSIKTGKKVAVKY